MKTKPISYFELTILLPIVVNELQQRNGVPIHAGELLTILNFYIESLENKSKKLSEDRLRIIINKIRQSGLLPVISGYHGYWIDKDKLKIVQMAESLESRANSILSAARGLRNYAKHL